MDRRILSESIDQPHHARHEDAHDPEEEDVGGGPLVDAEGVEGAALFVAVDAVFVYFGAHVPGEDGVVDRGGGIVGGGGCVVVVEFTLFVFELLFEFLGDVGGVGWVERGWCQVVWYYNAWFPNLDLYVIKKDDKQDCGP